MFDKSQAIFTYTLTNDTLIINDTDGVTCVAILLTAGVGTYRGNKRIGSLDSTATSLVVGTPVTISSEQSKFIENLIIDGSAGTIEIIAR